MSCKGCCVAHSFIIILLKFLDFNFSEIEVTPISKGRIKKKKRKNKRNFLLRWVGGVSTGLIFREFSSFFFEKKHKLKTFEIARKSL